MADAKTVTIVPLKGSNYPTWKIQCRMALMKEGLWGIVNETEEAPNAETQADQYAKFIARRDRALAVIVLSIEPSLLYLIGEPKNPITVWKKLGDHFQKKTWANKLELRRKLHSLRLKEGESVQEHIKSLTEVFEALSVVGDPVSEEDRVVQLLASLPDSFNMLVTALEANAVVPDMDVVTERILHEERKMKNRDDSGNGEVPGFLSGGGGGGGGAFAPPWNHFAPPWHSHIVNYKYCDRQIGNGTVNFGCQIAPETV